MATNLRLRPEAEQALRAAAARTGQSQQELIRKAVDRYLGLDKPSGPQSDSQALIAAGIVRPERSEFRQPDRLISLSDGLTTRDLLDRGDRI